MRGSLLCACLPGHLQRDGLELEISCVLDPAHWRYGYATEAVGAVLGWASVVLADHGLVACTQVANVASTALLERLGFTEIDRFVEFDADQGLWGRSLTDQDDTSNGSRGRPDLPISPAGGHIGAPVN